LWTATAISSVGDGLAFVALPLLAARSTHSAALVAAVAAAGRLAWLLAGPLAGVLADRLPRTKALVVIETGRAAILATVAIAATAGRTHVLALLLCAFGLGCLETLFTGLTSAGLADIVVPAKLAAANSRVNAVESAGQFFVGPAVGGVLFLFNPGLPFAIDAVSFAASAWLTSRAFRGRPHHRAAAGSLVRDLGTGWRFLAGHALLRALTALTGLYALFQAIATATLVLYCLHRLHIGVRGYGLFIAIASLGDIAGALLGERIADGCHPTRILVGAGIIVAACYLTLGLAAHPVTAVLALAVEATAVGVASVATTTFRQRTVPAQLLGRVGNTIRTGVCGAASLGLLLGGLISAHVGLAAPMIIAAAGQTVAVVTVTCLIARPISQPVEQPRVTPADCHPVNPTSR
jgi:MFS family permease